MYGDRGDWNGWQDKFDGSFLGFGMHPGFLFAGFGLLMLWALIWKGLALWKAARQGEYWWFLALLVINTAGLLEILYLYVFTKGGPDTSTNAAHKSGHQS